MAKKEKVYCENCMHYSRGKKLIDGEDCAKAVMTTDPGSATYLHPDRVHKEYCWEKNRKNKCQDYEPKELLS